jgi:hypothetical protein
MDTYFIRHTWDLAVDEKTRTQMWKARRVFIHYPFPFPWDAKRWNRQRRDTKSLNPDDYEWEGARRALRAMRRLAESGGYVCAHYIERASWLMGFVPPGSRVQLIRGKWSPERRPKAHNGIAIIKTLCLQKPRLVSPDACTMLLSAHPHQGTIMRWPSVGDLVESMVLRRKRRVTYDRLGASDQETMCAEFLRQREAREVGLPRLTCLLRDVGRTMKDLDILGIATDGKRILAQVTHLPWESAKARGKFDALKKFQSNKGNHLLLFCDCGARSRTEGVVIFPVREVYARFVKTPIGKLWRKHVSAGS